MGFGESLNAQLEEKIKQQIPEFQLKLENQYGKDKVHYSLDFKKSEKSEMYFLNKYQATLKNDDPAQEKTQTFYINKNNGVTAKEAYNLLSGRAVNKDLTNAEGKIFNAWLQLDFNEKDKNNNFKANQYHEGYGYDLEKVLKKHPIGEMQDVELKDLLMRSLRKGNVQPATFQNGDQRDSMFIEANPKYKNINIYDQDMKKVYQGAVMKQAPENKKAKDDHMPAKGKSEKNDLSEEAGEPYTKTKKSSKNKGVSI
jgi:hypothetical protein